VLLYSLTVISASNSKDAITYLSVDLTSFAGGFTISGEVLLRSSHFLLPLILPCPILSGISSYGLGKQ